VKEGGFVVLALQKILFGKTTEFRMVI